MRILLADDQAEVRSALRLLLEQETGDEVIAEARDALELLARMREEAPEVVLLDWELPGMPAGEVLATLRERYPGVVVIAMSGRPETRQEALACGADRFVSKGDPAESLLSAIREVSDSAPQPAPRS